MKKLFFFLAAIAVAFTANAKVTTISPDAENDALRLAVYYAEDGDIIEMTEGTYVQCNNDYVAFEGKSVTVKAAEGANVVLQLQVPINLTNGGKATLQGIKIDASRLTELSNYEHVVYPTDATEGKELYYGAVRTPLEFWTAWRVNDGDDVSRLMGLNNVAAEMKQLLSPKTLLDILYNFTTYSTNKKRQRIKVVCRYQQYEGANLIVQRVLENKIKRGLIWHFQGSGKSLLMLFAAQKMRKLKELKSPTVMIVVDRVDLDSQTQNVFKEAPNVMPTEDIDTLNKYLANDSRFIIITTIFKFKDAKANINLRDNIIVMVDEAHRTQEGDLGQRMRMALPNAFFFGLTGTPINKTDHNTFWTFGAQEDENGYMSRYSFEDALRDKTILPLHFEPRLLDIHIDREKVDEEF